MYKPLIVIISIFLGCQNKSSTIDTQPVNPRWEIVLSKDGTKPIARHEAAFVGVGDKFYLLGGRGILPTSIYDVSTNTWTEGAKPPIELHHFQPIVYEGKIYIIGAFTGSYPAEVPTENMYIYDPEKDSWETGPEIPESRRRGSTGNVLLGDKVLVLCGIKNGHIDDHKNWVDSYNFKTGEWSVLPEAPRARDHFQSVIVENKVYALAGRNSNAPENTFSLTIGEVDVYDIENKTWTTLKNNLPTERAGNMAIVWGSDILIVGGESASQEVAHSEVEALDIRTGNWKHHSSLNRGRHGSGVIEYKGKLYTVSGSGKRGGEPELESLERLF